MQWKNEEGRTRLDPGDFVKRSKALGDVSGSFTDRFTTGYVTSNWRRWHSECTCGTMNSDPSDRQRQLYNRSEGGVRRSQRGRCSCFGSFFLVEDRERAMAGHSSLWSTEDILSGDIDTVPGNFRRSVTKFTTYVRVSAISVPFERVPTFNQKNEGGFVGWKYTIVHKYLDTAVESKQEYQDLTKVRKSTTN